MVDIAAKCPRAVAILSLALWPLAARAGECAPDSGSTAFVAQTAIVAQVSGATSLKLESGETIVLAGIMAPVAGPVADETWPPRITSRAGLDRLVTGKTVTIAKDGRRTDRYGNIVAHLFTSGDGNSEQTWVEGELIAGGLARAAVLEAGDPCLDDMLTLESAARSDKRGHWATGIFGDRDAGDLYALRRLHDTFQSVTGTLDHIDSTHPTPALVLKGETSKSDEGFNVELAPNGQKGKRPRSSATYESLIGKRLRVRGWIEGRAHAYLVVADPRLIEIIEEHRPE